MRNYILDTGAGDMFSSVAERAKRLAESSSLRGANVEFDFNGIKCIVSKDTNTDLLYRDYSNAFTMDWVIVGPDCISEYEPEVIQELNKRSKQADERREIERKEYKAEQLKQKTNLQNQIGNIEIELIDKKIYQDWKDKNTDGYGAACFTYAEYWAQLMQIEIVNGKKVSDCAEKTSQTADIDGITGFMYGMAINILSKCWIHGEELRKWHNKEYKHEGDGVVNPAVLTVSI